MGKILGGIFALMLALPAMAESPMQVYGDDGFPWPWGTECPFPWQEIEGTYTLHAEKDSTNNGDTLVFANARENSQGIKFLTVTHYNRRGEVVSRGRAYSQKEQRVVRGILRTVKGNGEYQVIVRSYPKNRRVKKCSKNTDLVTAVSFCPLRGEGSRKCLGESYMLEKL